jgi:hypothetical protein
MGGYILPIYGTVKDHFGKIVGWAKPSGRANARPMTGSACHPTGAREMVGTALRAFAHPTDPVLRYGLPVMLDRALSAT